MAERAAWGAFPSVIRNGDLGQLSWQKEYRAAKSGDSTAALDLVERLLSSQTMDLIASLIGDSRPLITPVLALEESGHNKIPLAMAQVIAHKLSLDVGLDIVQKDKVGRTGKGADHRLAFNPSFDGRVIHKQKYLIVDDTLAMGGTIASLRGFVHCTQEENSLTSAESQCLWGFS